MVGAEMRDISIIIPTIRPDTVKKTVERIHSTTKDVDYEIIVSSPLDLNLPNVKHIKETKSNTKHEAINNLATVAEGEYIFLIPDYTLPDSNCVANLIQYMRQNDDKLMLVAPRWHTLWEVIREGWIWHYIYFTKTPCIKKENLKYIGDKFLNTEFVGYNGDIDISLRVLQANGKVEVCPDTFLEVYTPTEYENQTNNEKIFWEDNDRFIKLWEIQPHTNLTPDKYKSLPSNAYNILLNNQFVLPHEKCSRIFQLLKYNKIEELEKELNDNSYIVSDSFLLPLIAFCLLFIETIPHREKLLKYLFSKLYSTNNTWTLSERQEFINRFTIRPPDEIGLEDNIRIFGHYGTINTFYAITETYKKQILLFMDFLIEQKSIVKLSANDLYEQVKRQLNVN